MLELKSLRQGMHSKVGRLPLPYCGRPTCSLLLPKCPPPTTFVSAPDHLPCSSSHTRATRCQRGAHSAQRCNSSFSSVSDNKGDIPPSWLGLCSMFPPLGQPVHYERRCIFVQALPFPPVTGRSGPPLLCMHPFGIHPPSCCPAPLPGASHPASGFKGRPEPRLRHAHTKMRNTECWSLDVGAEAVVLLRNCIGRAAPMENLGKWTQGTELWKLHSSHFSRWDEFIVNSKTFHFS